MPANSRWDLIQRLKGEWELPSKTEGKIEGRKEVTGRRVRRHKQLLDFFFIFF